MSYESGLIFYVGLGVSSLCLMGIILALQVVRKAMESDDSSDNEKK